MDEQQQREPWWADEAKQAWKWLSTWIGIVLGAIPQIYDNVVWLQAHITVGQMHLIVTLLAAGGVVNTLRNKDGTTPTPKGT